VISVVIVLRFIFEMLKSLVTNLVDRNDRCWKIGTL